MLVVSFAHKAPPLVRARRVGVRLAPVLGGYFMVSPSLASFCAHKARPRCQGQAIREGLFQGLMFRREPVFPVFLTVRGLPAFEGFDCHADRADDEKRGHGVQG